jgi:hypothetical protein
MGFLSSQAKETVFGRCLLHIIPHFKHNKRRCEYLLLRWGYKYLRKRQFLVFSKAIIRKLPLKIPGCRLRDKLKKGLSD